MPTKAWIGIVTLVAALSVTAGCGQKTEQERSKQTSPPPAKLTNVRFAVNPVSQGALAIVAIEKGYFRDEGLDVEVSKFPTGKLAFDAVLGGAAEFATVAEVPIMYAAMSGQRPAIIATIERSGKSIKILARKDAGVAKPEDLRGKKIATFKGSSAEFFLDCFLKKYGMTQKDVEVIHLTPQDMVAALSRGEIAAMCIWEHHIYNAKTALTHDGVETIVFVEPDLYVETNNIAVREDYLTANKPTLLSFLRAFRRAEQLVRQSPGEAQAIVARYVGLDQAVLAAIWPDFDFALAFEPKLVTQLADQAKSAVEAGTIKAVSPMPDFGKFVHQELLRDSK